MPRHVSLAAFAGQPNMASPGSYWRIVEFTGGSKGGMTDAYPWGAAGRVGADGSLTDLPLDYTESGLVPPDIDGKVGFALDSGCLSADGTAIHWVGFAGDPEALVYGTDGYKVSSSAGDFP